MYKDLKIIFSLSFLSRILERNGETFEKDESCLQDNRGTIENIDYKIARYMRFHAHSMQIGGTMLVETSGRGGEHQGRVKKIKKKKKRKERDKRGYVTLAINNAHNNNNTFSFW